MEGMVAKEVRPALIVQELTSSNVPARYVMPQHDRPFLDAATAPIPVIDLLCVSKAGPDGGAAKEVAKLQSALEMWGLVMGCHVSMNCEWRAMKNVSKEFFHQPLEEKQEYNNLVDSKHFQLEGYGSEGLKSKDQTVSWSDRLYLKVEPEEDRNLPFCPKHPKSFRDALHEYTIQCSGVKNILLFAMVKILELKDNYFARQLDDRATTHARVIYYPPCPRPDLVLGIKPHLDASLISVLMVDDDVSGLQVLRDGVWYNVPTKPHTLLINLRDLTEIMSNSTFNSPVHKVVTNAKKGRMSVVLFYSPDFEKEVEPARELINNKQLALYKKVKIKDYVDGLFELFSKGARVIDTVKI